MYALISSYIFFAPHLRSRTYRNIEILKIEGLLPISLHHNVIYDYDTGKDRGTTLKTVLKVVPIVVVCGSTNLSDISQKLSKLE